MKMRSDTDREGTWWNVEWGTWWDVECRGSSCAATIALEVALEQLRMAKPLLRVIDGGGRRMTTL